MVKGNYQIENNEPLTWHHKTWRRKVVNLGNITFIQHQQRSDTEVQRNAPRFICRKRCTHLTYNCSFVN